jgi:nucleotide-binding universal stress UspA family protein
MYDILIPVDERVERAEAQVSLLADQPLDREQVRCTVVHAFEDDYGEEMLDRPRGVTRALDLLEEHGFAAEFYEINSPPSSQITAYASDEGYDLIVMGGRKRSPTSKAVFGSVTQSVLLEAEIPVTVVMREE